MNDASNISHQLYEIQYENSRLREALARLRRACRAAGIAHCDELWDATHVLSARNGELAAFEQPAAAMQIADRAVVADIESEAVPSVDEHGQRWYDTRAMLDPRELCDDFVEMNHQVLAQPGELPPVCADFRPSSDPANYVLWRTRVRDFTRGTLVCIDGRGLRTRTLDGRRVLMLDITDRVRLLQPPFDARAAAAGDGD